MQSHVNRMIRRVSTAALLATWLGAGPGATALAGQDADSQAAEGGEQADKVTVTPYETRPAPSHRVSLHDDRVFFLKKLQETDDGFVLHTMEDETIEVDQSEIAEILELKTE